MQYIGTHFCQLNRIPKLFPAIVAWRDGVEIGGYEAISKLSLIDNANGPLPYCKNLNQAERCCMWREEEVFLGKLSLYPKRGKRGRAQSRA